ncbi:MAG: dipeptidase [Sporomusaceae bacterium]|nr:dipeptidase [Sporomusaceae bacterium]
MRIIDLHCDTVLKLWEDRKNGRLRSSRLGVDAGKLIRAGALAQFFALFIDLQQHADPLAAVQSMATLFAGEVAANADCLAVAGSAADMEANRRQGKISCFLTLEEGGALAGRLENLQVVRELGVRLITLTWNYPNEIGYPNHEWQYSRQGLTAFGRDVVEEMNRLGLVVDVSHLSDQGVFDVARICRRPFIASHSNARAIAVHSRNLTDEMIRIIAGSGGVVGLNLCPEFLGGDSGIGAMVSHVRHIINTGGSDCAALGTDFDGIEPPRELADIGQIGRLARALEQAGLTETEREKFFWRNAARVISDSMD